MLVVPDVGATARVTAHALIGPKAVVGPPRARAGGPGSPLPAYAFRPRRSTRIFLFSRIISSQVSLVARALASRARMQVKVLLTAGATVGLSKAPWEIALWKAAMLLTAPSR